MNGGMEELITKLRGKQIWDETPVFCFTSDIDWASEEVMKEYFDQVDRLDIKPTLFVTHPSAVIEENFKAGRIERGIHPNFLPNSSHGNSFREVIETCMRLAPESYGFRCHRAFEVTDITHLLKNDYSYKYYSQPITLLQSFIRPVLHESGLVCYPVFFEDGTHLYQRLDLDFRHYREAFVTPGIKIISFHPMNFVFNSPTLQYMRQIKDSLSREEFQHISSGTIAKLRNGKTGIGTTVREIIDFVRAANYPVLSMNDLYHHTIK